MLDGRLWEAHYDLGLVFAKLGELAKAEEHLAKAASMAPDNEQVAVALCEVRRRRGETKAAAEGLEAYTKSHPNALDARARLVVVLREAGRFDDAIGHARYILARRPLDDARAPSSPSRTSPRASATSPSCSSRRPSSRTRRARRRGAPRAS